MTTCAGLAAWPSAQATTFFYAANLGPEVVGATGSGYVNVTYDDSAQTLAIKTEWSGLSGVTTVAHIHCCTAVPETGTIGVAVTPGTLPGFPVGVTASAAPYEILLELTQEATFTAAFRNNFGGGTAAGAELALFNGMNNGTAYFNIHSSTFPGGEIRGFLEPVPEPATYALMLAGLGLLGFIARRRRA